MNLNIGKWIRKENFTLFKPIKGTDIPIGGLEYWGTPIMKIETLKYSGDLFFVIINGRIFPAKTTKFVVISEDEAMDLLDKWNNCNLVETTHPGDITSCIREDNLKEKQKISTPEKTKEILFQWRLKQPHLPFDGYKCAHCGNYHIGKRKDI